MTWWRVGHKDDPAGFVPRRHCTWRGRWDDVQQEFRTSYAAEEPATALVEVFQDYAPTVLAQTTRGNLYPSPYLLPSEDLLPGREHLKALLGPSKWDWRALIAVDVQADEKILDLTGQHGRRWLEREIPHVLVDLGIKSVTAHTLTDPDRAKTQPIARAAYERGVSAFRYLSNVGEVPCVAVFEGHGKLRPRPAQTARLIDPEMPEASEILRAEIQLIHKEADDNTDELLARSAGPRTTDGP